MASRSTRTSSASSRPRERLSAGSHPAASWRRTGHRAQGGRDEARNRVWPRWGSHRCSTCSSTTRAATSTAPSAPRSPSSSIGDEATVDAEVRSIRSRRTRDGKRTIVNGDRVRRHRSARAGVLQPGLARAAAPAGHPGVAVREGRAVPGQAPAHEPGRRRAQRPTPTARATRQRRHRHGRARVPAVGEGRGAHVAAPARGRVVPRSARRRGASPTRSTAPAASDHDLVDRTRAYHDIHRPETMQDARDRRAPARSSTSSCACSSRSWRASARWPPRRHRHPPHGRRPARARVPRRACRSRSPATRTRAIAEITADLAAPSPMHRLLQGEVGSGKTVVALTALLTAVQGGYQGAFMAPTEVLAEQHELTMRSHARRARRAGGGRRCSASGRCGVALLTNRTPRRRAPAHRRRAARTATSTSSSARTRSSTAASSSRASAWR